ncbi:MAG TPA: hypothetical protein VM557_14905 [Thermoanaerobaculia bacterium]|nr:hypothetical protein [Thermoanaerobaculia bacterium]
MIDDEIKKMLAMQKAVEQADSAYRKPYEDQILRMARYQVDWQQQFAGITALTARDELGLQHIFPLADEEMRRLGEAIQPAPAIKKMMLEIEEEVERSERSLRELMEGILSPSVLSGYNSLSEMLHNVGIQAAEIPSYARMDFAHSLVAPVEQYGRFLQETVGRLAAADIAPSMSRALQGSILLADDVFGTNSNILELFGSGSFEPTDTALLSSESLSLPFVQRAELITAREDLQSLEIGDLAQYSPAHEVAVHANRLLQGIFDVNRTRKLKGKEETFAPTTRVMIAVRDLPNLVAQDESSLGDLLDTLFVLLYEAAGDDHLRYLDAEGGELTRADCEIIWIIKHLRANARHDLDHGKPGTAAKKWQVLGKDLEALGLSHFPRTKPEFHHLQARLIQRAERFINAILDRLS